MKATLLLASEFESWDWDFSCGPRRHIRILQDSACRKINRGVDFPAVERLADPRSAGAAPRPRADRGRKRRHPRRGGGPRRLAAPACLAAEDRRQRHGPGSLAVEDCAGHLGAAGASVAFVRAAVAGRLAVAPACLATRRPGRREYGRPPPLTEGQRPAVAAARHSWRWGAPVLGGAAAAQPARDHDRAAAVLPGGWCQISHKLQTSS